MDTAVYPNWFAMYADQYFERHLRPLAGQPGLRFLQIGAFTGDASVWLLDNILGGDGVLIDVDTWQGSDEPAHHAMDFAHVERVYDRRTAEAQRADRLFKWKVSSETFFARFGAAHDPDGAFDFIYIDGDHTAYGVLNDAVNAYRVLKVGGLLAFDDYLWHSGKGIHHDPGLAIDAIGAIYRDRLEVIEGGAQVWFRRVA